MKMAMIIIVVGWLLMTTSLTGVASLILKPGCQEQWGNDFPVGPLIKKCCTLDQGKAVITFLDAILDKTLRSTIALLVARGCGKSAALCLAIARAIVAGCRYSNIFVTAPSPKNLRTLFVKVEALDNKVFIQCVMALLYHTAHTLKP